jgi:Domain of unknown function (DUF4349)
MSQAEFENILRAAAPTAPQQLRDRVRALPEPATRLQLRLRPALVAAVAIAISVGVGAAAIGGLSRSGEPSRTSHEAALRNLARPLTRADAAPSVQPKSGAYLPDTGSTQLRALSPVLPSSRLQRYDVALSARVDDLSQGTKSAIRTTRRLGGYVAAADYATGQSTGDSRLDLRVPVQNVQRAIARFTELGTILSQRISVADLQAGVDRLEQRLAKARSVVDEFEAKQRRVGLTLTEQARLDNAKRTIVRLSKRQSSLVSQGTYAKISLTLTTRKPAAKHTAPGRFDRFRGDAGDILGKEAIIVLYSLVVAGPFALLAALALLGERARRRRADSRLLEETG